MVLPLNMRTDQRAPLYFLAVLLILMNSAFDFSICENTSVGLGCPESEKHALLEFKKSLKDKYHALSSWKSGNDRTDCCKRYGVTCDHVSEHVVKLDLRATLDSFCFLEAEEVNPSLLELKHLSYLDLSGNYLGSNAFPKYFGSMNQLRYLNLSHSGFRGKVPSNFGNLTNLHTLDISHNVDEAVSLHADDISWLSQLTSLKYLDMSGVDLSIKTQKVLILPPSLLEVAFSNCGLGILNITYLPRLQSLKLSGNEISDLIPNVMQNMTTIKFLDLSSNKLSSIPLWLVNLKSLVHLNLSFNELSVPFPNSIQNLTSIEFLDLSFNKLSSSIPFWLGNLKTLVHLYLSFNELSGSIPNSLQTLTSLRSLDLHSNKFTSSVPSWLGELSDLDYLNLAWNQFDSISKGTLPSILNNACHLKELDLSYNSIQGEAFGSYSNLSGCIQYDLVKLDLRYNNFSGGLPSWLGEMESLTELFLQANSFHGPIPPSLGNLSSLETLDLSDNQLSSFIPDSLGKLVKLSNLNLSVNSLEGTIYEIHFGNLSSLDRLDIGSNDLTIKLEMNWVPPFNLAWLGLRSCNIGTEFPQWLLTQKTLKYLNLYDNQINGPLTEDFADTMPHLHAFLLGNNRINGSIPSSLCKLEHLFALDLSMNKLSGNISDCWREHAHIGLISLSSNELSGTIPSSLGNLVELSWLNLSNNSLRGEIPSQLKNCNNLVILDLGENQLSGKIPSWLGYNLTGLKILRLRSNMLHGSIPAMLCQLSELRVIDLANNQLAGTIPSCIGNLEGMITGPSLDELNNQWAFYYNAGNFSYCEGTLDEQRLKQVMKGRELEYHKIYKYLVNMDLSSNKLAGMIPKELTLLHGLMGLNLAHNNLSGDIPNNIGDMNSLESIDLSNNQFSGTIPTSISDITSLSYLNFSMNNFSGPIPHSTQLSTLGDPSSIYAGNPYLCGPPLSKKCPGDEEPNAPPPERENKEEVSDKLVFFIVVMAGFGTGFWGAIGVLFFKKRWRHAYFQFMDKQVDNIYVTVAINIGRLKKKIQGNHADW